MDRISSERFRHQLQVAPTVIDVLATVIMVQSITGSGERVYTSDMLLEACAHALDRPAESLKRVTNQEVGLREALQRFANRTKQPVHDMLVGWAAGSPYTRYDYRKLDWSYLSSEGHPVEVGDQIMAAPKRAHDEKLSDYLRGLVSYVLDQRHQRRAAGKYEQVLYGQHIGFRLASFKLSELNPSGTGSWSHLLIRTKDNNVYLIYRPDGESVLINGKTGDRTRLDEAWLQNAGCKVGEELPYQRDTGMRGITTSITEIAVLEYDRVWGEGYCKELSIAPIFHEFCILRGLKGLPRR